MAELDSSAVVRARLYFLYDGTRYSGWAAQPDLTTVQGELHGALERVVRTPHPITVTVAGRTDAGVHARGQVGHMDIMRTAWEEIPGRSPHAPADSLCLRLNAVLPEDIVVRSVDEAPDGFDARFSALERTYRYRLSDALVTRDPLRRSDVVWHRNPLDVDTLARASATLTGLRDFTPFCRAREGATMVRELKQFTWERPESGADAGLVVATVRADAFCHSMVRSLVGAVLAVGDGRRDASWLAAAASHSTRSPAVRVAPPRGLTLEHVAYPPDAELAARAQLTRARRTLD